MTIFRLSEAICFPPPHFADADGLLAVGGDLSEQRLLLAYSMGIFPWYCVGEPILWWSPDPRLVLYPGDLRVSRSLAKTIRKGAFTVTLDRAFERVITHCAEIRLAAGEETWIVDDMVEAYLRLHRQGFAHSVEAWQDGELAGGLYGVSLGRAFFGESMFAKKSNASKVAFVRLVRHLAERGFDLVDCQVRTDHLMRFGAVEISRERFLKHLEQSLKAPTLRGPWSFDTEGEPPAEP